MDCWLPRGLPVPLVLLVPPERMARPVQTAIQESTEQLVPRASRVFRGSRVLRDLLAHRDLWERLDLKVSRAQLVLRERPDLKGLPVRLDRKVLKGNRVRRVHRGHRDPWGQLGLRAYLVYLAESYALVALRRLTRLLQIRP